jgi:predicted alpha/beta-hydrolase family hydrolase
MNFLHTGPDNAPAILMLAHGAGAPMDSRFMNDIAALLAERGLHVARFEFAYMAGRRTGAGRKPPPRAERVMDEYRQAVEELNADRPLFIGGKSMGGRVASMVAGELFDAGRTAGLVCLGYPFHPPGSPEKLRTAHLKGLAAPALICQGTRDPFGTRNDVAGYDLSPTIDIHWIADGDHDFRPAKGSGATAKENLIAATDAIADWMKAAIRTSMGRRPGKRGSE